MPHCGYHWDGTPRRFFEGWYWKVQIPGTPHSFALIYSIEVRLDALRLQHAGWHVAPVLWWHPDQPLYVSSASTCANLQPISIVDQALFLTKFAAGHLVDQRPVLHAH